MTPAPWDDHAVRLHCLKLALRHLGPCDAWTAVREAETLRQYLLGKPVVETTEAESEPKAEEGGNASSAGASIPPTTHASDWIFPVGFTGGAGGNGGRS